MGRGELTGLPSEPLCAHQGPPFPLAKIKPFPAAQGFKGDFSSLSHSVCYRYTAPRSPKLYKKRAKWDSQHQHSDLSTYLLSFAHPKANSLSAQEHFGFFSGS